MPSKPKPFAAGDWKIDDAAAYRTKGSDIFPEYRFPFVTMDPTRGGSNLGRMEWCLEPLRGKKERKSNRRIGGLALWARQTRDPRYVGVVFHLPCNTEALTSSCASDRHHFVRQVWHMSFCELHDTLILMAYPENHHSVLVVKLGSSISNELYFE